MKRVDSEIMLVMLLMGTLTLACNIQQAQSQPPGTEWTQTYGGPNADGGSSVVQTGDGGYAIAGMTDSFGAGSLDFWLVKTDASGNMQWNQTYGGPIRDEAYSMVQTVDGGYAIAGGTESFGAGAYDFWLVKTDASGNVQWNQTYGGVNGDWGYSMVQTSDGGYAMAGGTEIIDAGRWDVDFWLVKTDASGNVLWNATYGGTGNDWALSMVQTSEGGYAMAGWTNSFGAGSDDFWLVKTDASGNVQWNQTYGGTGGDNAWSLVQTSDGGYAMVGTTHSFGVVQGDFYLVKTDPAGNMQWNQTYGGKYWDWPYSVVQTVDGGYAMVGYTTSFGTIGDFWLVKTDASGNVQWNQTYGGAGYDTPHSIIQTSDGGYALTGDTNSFSGDGSYEVWLIKLAGQGPRTWIVDDDGPADFHTIQEAINAASEGDTVFVRNGTYYEHVVVNRSVSLIGEDEKSTIIDGEGAGNVAKITADDVNMTGFTVQMSGGDVWDYSGITLQNCSNVNVFENSMIDNSWGICLENSTGNRINENTISRNKRTLGSWGGGVLLSNGASSNAVVDNIITDNLYNGVFVVSSGNSIVGNTIADNGYVGLRLDSGGSVIYHNNFENNTFHASTNSINTWDDGYPSGGNYWSDYDGADLFGGHYQNVSGSDGIGDIPYVVYGSNRDNYPLTKPYSGSHDVGITSFATSKTGCPPMPTVGQGFSLNVTMNTLNYGINAETLNVTTHANSTAIQTFANVAMAGRNSTTLTFTWNTTGFAYGNYTLSAYAWPVPGETYTADNTYTYGLVSVTIMGDIDGNGWVNVLDAIDLSTSFGKSTGQAGFNPNADFNHSGVVNILDAITLATHYDWRNP